MLAFYQYLISQIHDEKGQSMAEYALIIALIAVVLIAALQGLAGGIGGVFTAIEDAFTP